MRGCEGPGRSMGSTHTAEASRVLLGDSGTVSMAGASAFPSVLTGLLSAPFSLCVIGLDGACCVSNI